ncbi:response regulator transcription factor [Dactylosporangium sp. NPDC049525]|uniref:response regulator transcription factor n=1 Tax=Dactylosporangium sp. NPDC049525 TaxID=3154730 RepID=UPI003421ED8B
MIRLAIVDDQALVREGLALILGAEPDIEVVAEFADGAGLLRDPVPADIILLDLYLPGADGVATMREMRSRRPEVKVLMLTTVGSAADIQRALTAGADGFVLKDATGAELAAAVRGAHAGVRPLSASAADLLWPRRPARPGPSPDLTVLTPREREVLDLLGQGLGNREIAAALALAERTVKTHVSNVLAKLDVASRTQAALLTRDLPPS